MGGVAPGCWYCQLLTLLRLSFHLLVWGSYRSIFLWKPHKCEMHMIGFRKAPAPQQKISLDQLQWMSVVGLFIGPKKSFVRILLTRKSGHSAAVSMGGAKPTAEALISLKLCVQDDLEVSALLKQFTILWLSRWVEMRLSSQYDVNFLLVHLSQHL